ncbi:hypothetical protein GCM10009650_21980 [Nesterenkonia jeotgali]
MTLDLLECVDLQIPRFWDGLDHEFGVREVDVVHARPESSGEFLETALHSASLKRFSEISFDTFLSGSGRLTVAFHDDDLRSGQQEGVRYSGPHTASPEDSDDGWHDDIHQTFSNSIAVP